MQLEGGDPVLPLEVLVLVVLVLVLVLVPVPVVMLPVLPVVAPDWVELSLVPVVVVVVMPDVEVEFDDELAVEVVAVWLLPVEPGMLLVQAANINPGSTTLVRRSLICDMEPLGSGNCGRLKFRFQAPGLVD